MATSSELNHSIKEENHNKTTINSKQLLVWSTYGHKYRRCHFCGGFYGPCFGEPICPTCHIFLFPDDINAPDDVVHIQEKGDDDDSGNDEPSDFFFQNNQSQNRHFYNSTKPDRLAERIKMLTIHKEEDLLSEGLVELLPAEVLLIVFSYLDDISLWSCGQVCRRWYNLIYSETTQEQWKKFCCRRWPLYTPNSKCKVHGWKAIYTRLIRSTPCLMCLHQMTMQVNLPFEESSWRRNRLKNELKALQSDPPEGIEAIPLDRQWCHWQSSILGPVGSPYEGGRFFLYIQIPHSYPMRPPVIRFITRVFHANISRHGDIGIDSIHHNWSLALTISKVLISIQSLLTDPYCHICMEPKIGQLYANDRPTFDRIARMWTRCYAIHDKILLNSDYCRFLESG